MMRAAVVVAVLGACACAEPPEVGGRRQWKLHVERTTLADGCGRAGRRTFGPLSLDVETWAPDSSRHLIRFIDAGVLRLGEARPIELPEGIVGAQEQFSWGKAVPVYRDGQAGGSAQQGLAMALSSTDAGVVGTLSLTSNFHCSPTPSDDCTTPPFTNCSVEVPLRLEESPRFRHAIGPTAEPVDGGVDYIVAVATMLPQCSPRGRNEVRFENWSISNTRVQTPVGDSMYGEFVDHHFSGALNLAGPLWTWESAAEGTSPRATLGVTAFEPQDTTWLTGSVNVRVTSSCTELTCFAQRCTETLSFTAFKNAPR